jgi:HlyD family secretion protein
MRRLLWLLILLGLAGAGTAAYVYYNDRPAPLNYVTSRVERGQIAATVNATGTVNAVVTVQVGSQITGRIQQLFADFNTAVREDQIIAQIDPALFEARVSQVRAALSNARAAVRVAEATVENTRATVETAQANTKSAQANIERAQVAVVDAQRTLERRQGLAQRSLTPQSELDTAQTAYDSAVAQLKATEAQYDAVQGQAKSARAQLRLTEAQHAAAVAQVEQAQAALQVAELDLSHTTIRSPVNGIVIARNVDVGQTVAASLQAPTLFLIAQDLTRMQVNTNVSEADIGKIREGQTATFTVDAYADSTFTGKVVQVRNAPITVQNVVTYDAVVEVANPQAQLRPGMTANVSFIIAKRDEVLKVPNAALRFQPDGAGPPTGAPESGGEVARGDRGQALQQRLTAALTLTSEQRAQLEDILQKSRQQGLRLREQGLSEENLRVGRRELQTQTRAKIRSILTDTQRQKYEEMAQALDRQREEARLQGRPGRVWRRQADGILQPLVLRLGISDEAFTEVVAGELQEGQEVITGILATAKRSTSTPTSTPPGFGQRAF